MAVIATFNDLLLSDGNDTYPIGTIIMYSGTDIGGGDTADITTRTDKICDGNGDGIDFDEGDWYVANGQTGTPNLIGQMIRGAVTSAQFLGDDDAIAVTHTHTGTTSAGTHSHTLSSTAGAHVHSNRIAIGTYMSRRASASSSWFWIGNMQDNAGTKYTSANAFSPNTHTISTSSHNHGGTTESAGVAGTDLNIPAYNELILVIKIA